MIYTIATNLGYINKIESLSKDDFTNRLCGNIKSKGLPDPENKTKSLISRIVELMETDNSVDFSFGPENYSVLND